MSALLDEVLEAHGGLERWRAARTVRARVRSGGFLIRTRVPGNRFADYRLTVEVQEPRAVMDPFPRTGQRGVFERGRVRIEGEAGDVLASRDDPRAAFFGRAGLRRNLRWDALDSTYFAGYAMWNYLTTPLLLTRDGVRVDEGERWRGGAGNGGASRSISPRASTRTRARQSSTSTRGAASAATTTSAEVVGGWARAAHHCAEHAQAGGLVFPTRRWVRPIGPGNRVAPWPTLVWIELAALQVQKG